MNTEDNMTKEKIARINELARKSRTTPLSQAEKAEQEKLRNEYRAEFRAGLMGELDRIYVIDEDGKEKKLIQ